MKKETQLTRIRKTIKRRDIIITSMGPKTGPIYAVAWEGGGGTVSKLFYHGSTGTLSVPKTANLFKHWADFFNVRAMDHIKIN